MALKLNMPYFETIDSLVAGNKLSGWEVLVLHIHKDGICICFFSDSITAEQFKVLKNKIMEIYGFSFQYDGSMQEEGNVSVFDVLNYAKKIVDRDNMNAVNFVRKVK